MDRFNLFRLEHFLEPFDHGEIRTGVGVDRNGNAAEVGNARDPAIRQDVDAVCHAYGAAIADDFPCAEINHALDDAPLARRVHIDLIPNKSTFLIGVGEVFCPCKQILLLVGFPRTNSAAKPSSAK